MSVALLTTSKTNS